MSFFTLKVQLSDHDMDGHETYERMRALAELLSERDDVYAVTIEESPELQYRDGGVE